jgi:hypothetical protein
LEIIVHPPLPGKELTRLPDKEILDKVTEVIESENTDLDI